MDSCTARALIEQIAKDHGHLGEEILKQMPPELRREVEHALLQKDGIIMGSSVIKYELIGVKSLTFQMVHDKLVAEASGQSTAEKTKQTIWLLNSYIQTAKQLPDPRQALHAKVFPVGLPTGTVELCSSSVDFAINDRKHLSDLFSGKARSLDFDVNEVIRLQPFLKWAGLDK
jgi:hypothetical protein